MLDDEKPTTQPQERPSFPEDRREKSEDKIPIPKD
jgi:hypothetical protein